jgi:EmrB/QacA subfamily drug resistance transporter
MPHAAKTSTGSPPARGMALPASAPSQPEAARPSPTPAPTQSVLVIFGALVLVMLLASLDQTIVSTALPTIVGELGGLAHLSWVVTAYLLATTVVGPLHAKLGDLYGRKIILQIAIVTFLVGSALCGQARSMGALIVFRVVQGLGGGGLMVTTTAIIGDIIAPRERGRYQGIFGAVFGVSTVVGPLLGGFFVEHLSWRWIFYINLPIGLVALAVIGVVFQHPSARRQRRIDWAGAALLALLLSGVVLATSFGGAVVPWSSPSMLAILVVAAGATCAFLLVERRAEEPVLPLSLFRSRTFVVATIVGLIVGLAMFGSVTYLPLYLQVVKGSSPSGSGLHLAPMMGGMLVTSIGSGQIISRTGRYKIFPVLGTAIMVIALGLLSRLSPETSLTAAGAMMLLLGLGMGMVMQVLVMAVQNAVSYENLGVATSGATLFRMIGGAVGVSTFGAIFAARLAAGLPAMAGGMAGETMTPRAIAHLPRATQALYADAFSRALHPVFLLAAAAAVVAFIASCLLEERPLRQTVATGGLGEGFAMPRTAESLPELERALSELARRENRGGVYQRLAARAGITLSPPEIWLLFRIEERAPQPPSDLARELHLPEAALTELLARLEGEGHITRDPAGRPRMTDAGCALRERLLAARREALASLLGGWAPEAHAEVRALVDQLARALVSEPPLDVSSAA